MNRRSSATCETCQTIFENVPVQDEDSIYLALEMKPCADPACGATLCRCCAQFQCDYCCETFCQEHRTLVADGTPRPLQCCAACAEEIAAENPLPLRLPPASELRPVLVATAGVEVA